MKTEITRRVLFGGALATFTLGILSLEGQTPKSKDRLDWSSLQLDTQLNGIKNVLDQYKSPDDIINSTDKAALRGYLDLAMARVADVNSKSCDLLGTINVSEREVDLYNLCERESNIFSYVRPPSKDLSGTELRAGELKELYSFLNSDSFPLGYSINIVKEDSDAATLNKILKLNRLLPEIYRILKNNRFFKEPSFVPSEAP